MYVCLIDTSALTLTSTASASCTRLAVLAVSSSFNCLHSNTINHFYLAAAANNVSQNSYYEIAIKLKWLLLFK